MGWVDSPKFFCALLETLTDVANSLVHTLLPVPGYSYIFKTPKTRPGSPQTLDSLTHIDCFMDEVTTSVQVGLERQRQVWDGTFRSLKWLFLSLAIKTKDSVSVKKLRAGKGEWTYVKELLWWTIGTEAGRVSVTEKKLQ